MFVQLTKEFMGKKAGERIDVSEADAQALVGQALAVPVHDDLITPAVQKAMEQAFSGFQKGLDAVISTALRQFQDAQSQARRHAVPAIFGPQGDGDPKQNFGDWLVCVARTSGKNHKAAAEASDRLEKVYGSSFSQWQQKAPMGETSGSTGGYIVPPDFYHQLLQIAAEQNTFRQNAFVMPMASATLQFPFLDITTVQSAGVSPFFGGVQAYWTAEAQTRTETEPQFKMMELKAQELSGYSVSSNILLQDAAFGLEKFLMVLFGNAVGWFEEYAFLQGNGVGKPIGVVNANAAIPTGNNGGKTGRQTANQISYGDVAVMFSKFLPGSIAANRGRWFGSPTIVPQLLQLQDGASRAIFISIDQGAVKAPIWKLLGLPITITEKLPALGTKGDLILVDPSLYVIGDRMQLEIAASEHVNFLKNQMTWRFVQRVDGRPWMDNPVTLQDGTSQVSPFVILN
jgi:HK97 family phage major capsid protein